jgi:hypothetical protein
MKNPIPHSNLFTSPSLEEIQKFINSLPTKEQANANLVFMFTLNATHDLVGTKLIEAELGLTV